MSKPDAVTTVLAQTRLFGLLADADREAVAKQMRPVNFDPGQVIFSRGDRGSEIYLVTEGRVRLSILTLEGRELSFTHASEGHVFGEIATLDGGSRTADATAVGRVRALTLSHAALHRLIATMPGVAEAMIKFLCTRLREADQQLESVALHSIEVRLARYLLSIARGGDPSGKAARVNIDLAMSQGELALLLGATRPKVNAALASLEASGAIARKDAKIACEIEELQMIAQLD